MGLTCIHSLVGDTRADETVIWCSKFEEYGMGITKYGCDPMTGQKEYIITEPKNPAVVTIHCPVCGWQQEVEKDMWDFQSSPGGHGYTCGSGKCPSHTYMVLGLNVRKVSMSENEHKNNLSESRITVIKRKANAFWDNLLVRLTFFFILGFSLCYLMDLYLLRYQFGG